MKAGNDRRLIRFKISHGQHGVVIPFVVIGMLAILAVAGMAIDGSHALANKTRMQNTVDAAALAAAKELDTSGDTVLATAAAYNIIGINSGSDGNHELQAAYSAGEISISVQFSSTVAPFNAGSGPGPFVRVIATGFETDTTLSRVIGFDVIPTPASAVAGPSGPLGNGPGAEVCNIAPIAVCPPVGGLQNSKLEVLKPGPGNHGDIGPGNYKMLRLNCAGGDCLRKAIAGDYDACATDEEQVETEPGVSSGPTSQGFNTRFGIYQGAGLNAEDYPPDRILKDQSPMELKACEDETGGHDLLYLTTGGGNSYCRNPRAEDQVTMGNEVPYSYGQSVDETWDGYEKDSMGDDEDFEYGSVKHRRLLVFPLIADEDCMGEQSGQASLKVDGFACFLMLQPLESGQNDGGGKIIGEFVTDCAAAGTSSHDPGSGPNDPNLYKIQLYKDSGSQDS